MCTWPVDPQLSPLAVVARLFLRLDIHTDRPDGGVPRRAVNRVLPKVAVTALRALNVLVLSNDGKRYHSMVQIAPYDGESLHLAMDFFQVTGGFWAERFDAVMPLGGDSDGLAYGAPRDRQVDRLLDVCTGTGVQAIVALTHYAREAHLVDVNPRAVRFARFNLALNGLAERGHVHHGDLFAGLPRDVSSAPFDLITANPPYVADEKGRQGRPTLYAAGGPYGYRITQRIVTGAAPLLRHGGALRKIATIQKVHHYRDLLRTWWEAGAVAAASHALYLARTIERVDKKDWTFAQPDIDNWANALIWIDTADEAVAAGARDGASRASFTQIKLSNWTWQLLTSEMGTREMLQYLLRRRDPSSLLADYAGFIEDEHLRAEQCVAGSRFRPLGWPLAGWWLVAGGWWLVAGGC
jgi:predicted RNA methylase